MLWIVTVMQRMSSRLLCVRHYLTKWYYWSIVCGLWMCHAAGVIVIINNYTGDRLNFGIAIERARAEGIHVDVIINAEDCAISAKDKSAGRRGLAASIFIMKAYFWHYQCTHSTSAPNLFVHGLHRLRLS